MFRDPLGHNVANVEVNMNDQTTKSAGSTLKETEGEGPSRLPPPGSGKNRLQGPPGEKDPVGW